MQYKLTTPVSSMQAAIRTPQTPAHSSATTAVAHLVEQPLAIQSQSGCAMPTPPHTFRLVSSGCAGAMLPTASAMA
jgi:hypothetical protein